MDYASPAAELMQVIIQLFITALMIFASIVFLREKTAGAWLMLGGSLIGLASTTPSLLMAIVAYVGIGALSDWQTKLIYLPVWLWLGSAGGALFGIGLLLVAFCRRGLARRITELETLLAGRNELER